MKNSWLGAIHLTKIFSLIRNISRLIKIAISRISDSNFFLYCLQKANRLRISNNGKIREFTMFF